MGKLFIVAGETIESATKVALALELPNPTLASSFLIVPDGNYGVEVIRAARDNHHRLTKIREQTDDVTIVCERSFEDVGFIRVSDMKPSRRMFLNPRMPEIATFICEQGWVQEEEKDREPTRPVDMLRFYNLRNHTPGVPNDAFIDVSIPKLICMNYVPWRAT